MIVRADEFGSVTEDLVSDAVRSPLYKGNAQVLGYVI